MLALSSTVRAVLALLGVGSTRFAVSDVLSLLEEPALRRRFGFDADAIEILRAWVRDSGIRWGLPGAMPDNTPAPGNNSWQAGLDRMLLGVALEEDSLFEGIQSYVAGSGQANELIGLLAEFIEQLKQQARKLEKPRTIRQWQLAVNALIGDCLDNSQLVEQELKTVRDELMSLTEESERAGFDAHIERDVLRRLLEKRLQAGVSSHQFLNGAVTFARLTPQRSLPARIICVLGLNADAYPRRNDPRAWDMTARYPRRGDGSRGDDERYILLETLLSAREHCYLSWTGIDERSGQSREPSLMISELRAHLDRRWQPPSDCELASVSEYLLRVHPLKPFSQAYFDPDSRLFSYRHEWLPAAPPLEEQTSFLDTDLDPPEQAILEWTGLRDFFRNPSLGFLQQRLGVYFDPVRAASFGYRAAGTRFT